MDQDFDYLIIGAGSAGCVLANRLSSNEKNSIALFESGLTDNTWKVNMPSALLYTMHDPNMNWKYYSEPEPYLNNLASRVHKSMIPPSRTKSSLTDCMKHA